MSRIITDRAAVQRMVEQVSAQLIEVLPRDEYESEHLAGAVSLPLEELDVRSVARLDREQPVIVYCNDFT